MKRFTCPSLLALLLVLLPGCSSEPSTPEHDLGPPAGTDCPDGGGEPTEPGPAGAEASDTLCGNGLDDDDNGFADCNDFWCRDSVTVTVCGSLENTAAACSDGVDNPESPRRAGDAFRDGLVDCADPDCAKNPLLAGVCPPLRFELGTACRGGEDEDGDGLVDCADPDCLQAGETVCSPGEKKRVLFDDTHRQRAGSADWVVDVPGRRPWPSLPEAETDWAGGLSSFGFELMRSGRYVVETLPASGPGLTWGEACQPQDLSGYQVLVLVEPSAPFSAGEADALVSFVRNGGGLLLVADHLDSDRDGNGWDSVQAFNDLLRRAGGGELAANPFGLEVAELGYEASGLLEQRNGKVARTVDPGAEGHPVLAGAHGKVDGVGMYKGGLFVVHPEINPAAKVLLHAVPLTSPGYEQGSPYVVVTELGAGRVVALGDSAILNDGTDSHGHRSPGFDSWHEAGEDNAALVLNAVDWLAGL